MVVTGRFSQWFAADDGREPCPRGRLAGASALFVQGRVAHAAQGGHLRSGREVPAMRGGTWE
jgi:hypothetical protein